jgi:predicted nucleotidyltransferase component of viral defense system
VKYRTARDFRRALNDRLREQAGEGEDLARLQRRLAYERFLARLFALVGDTWVLKGGYALELRLGGKARATKDLDFHAPSNADLLDTLQAAAEQDLGDHFRFVVQPPERGTLGGPPEGGQRFRVQAFLDGALPYTTFLIDVSQGDLIFNRIDTLPARVDLSFAGLPPQSFPSYPLPEHFAEKLHAYTRPRPEGGRTRVKDLLDLSLIIGELRLQSGPGVLRLVQAVFDRYGSHPLPEEVPAPPEDWRGPYQVMAQSLAPSRHRHGRGPGSGSALSGGVPGVTCSGHAQDAIASGPLTCIQPVPGSFPSIPVSQVHPQVRLQGTGQRRGKGHEVGGDHLVPVGQQFEDDRPARFAAGTGNDHPAHSPHHA